MNRKWLLPILVLSGGALLWQFILAGGAFHGLNRRYHYCVS